MSFGPIIKNCFGFTEIFLVEDAESIVEQPEGGEAADGVRQDGADEAGSWEAEGDNARLLAAGRRKRCTVSVPRGGTEVYPSVAGDLGDEIQQCRPVLNRLRLRGVEDEEEEDRVTGWYSGGSMDFGLYHFSSPTVKSYKLNLLKVLDINTSTC